MPVTFHNRIKSSGYGGGSSSTMVAHRSSRSAPVKPSAMNKRLTHEYPITCGLLSERQVKNDCFADDRTKVQNTQAQNIEV
jgi:hypothetical protein